MRARINATRMELLRLRKRLALARRGHRLLKDKQDELVRRFFLLLEDYLRLRHRLHRVMKLLSEKSLAARVESSADEVQVATWPHLAQAGMTSKTFLILNLRVPAYELHLPEWAPSYGPNQLPAAYDELAAAWHKTVPLLVEVGQKEKALELLTTEIESTRRRVNALEYNLIPEQEEGIHTITLKLAEDELSNLTRLMRIQDIVRRH